MKRVKEIMIAKLADPMRIGTLCLWGPEVGRELTTMLVSGKLNHEHE